MLDLFDKKPNKENSYEAKDIEVLEGLEPVRQRPGMYIGGTDKKALHHLASEIIDNSMDEAVAGHASIIYIKLKIITNYVLEIMEEVFQLLNTLNVLNYLL